MTQNAATGGESTGPLLVADYLARPARLRALLALWDTSFDELLDRLAGVTDEEWLWEPGPGASTVRRVDGTWPGTAAEGVAGMRDGLAAWRHTLDQVEDDDLDTVGRCAFPHGLDPDLPLIDIAWWNTRELVHHAADIATVRDLYAVRTTPTNPGEQT